GLAEWVTWDSDPARQARLADIVPRLAAAAVVVKLLLAGWLLRSLHRRGEGEAATARRLIGGWLAAAVVLFSVLSSFVPSSLLSASSLALCVILFLPLARLAAGPAALAWNRCR